MANNSGQWEADEENSRACDPFPAGDEGWIGLEGTAAQMKEWLAKGMVDERAVDVEVLYSVRRKHDGGWLVSGLVSLVCVDRSAVMVPLQARRATVVDRLSLSLALSSQKEGLGDGR